MSQAKPRKERKTRYYCGLCGNYDIVVRLEHLKKVHNATAQRHSLRFKPIIDVVFGEVAPN